MFFKVVFAVTLVVFSTEARLLTLQNSGGNILKVSVTGQGDQVLLPGQRLPLTVADDWQGTITARQNPCEVCDGPQTKAELSLGSVGGTDSYQVSLVDGFNVPIKIIPKGGVNCQAAVCGADLNRLCPLDSQVTTTLGEVVACKNSPQLFRQVCPGAVVSSADTLNVLSCQAIGYTVILR